MIFMNIFENLIPSLDICIDLKNYNFTLKIGSLTCTTNRCSVARPAAIFFFENDAVILMNRFEDHLAVD